VDQLIIYAYIWYVIYISINLQQGSIHVIIYILTLFHRRSVYATAQFACISNSTKYIKSAVEYVDDERT